MAVGDVYQVEFFMVNNDRFVSTCLHYEETSPRLGTIAEVTAQLANDAEDDFWIAFWRQFCAAAVDYDHTRAQMIYPTREAPLASFDLQGDAGTATGDAMNGQTAALIAEYGVTWNREFQGRAFLPGLSEDLADQGRWQAVSHVLAQAAATTLYTTPITLAGPAGGTFTPVVLSAKRLKASTPPVVNTIASAIVRPRISRQVKRKTRTLTLTA